MTFVTCAGRRPIQDFDVDEYVKKMGYDRERDIDKVTLVEKGRVR